MDFFSFFFFWYVGYLGLACAHQTKSLKPEQAFWNKFYSLRSVVPRVLLVRGVESKTLEGANPQVPGLIHQAKPLGLFILFIFNTRFSLSLMVTKLFLDKKIKDFLQARSTIVGKGMNKQLHALPFLHLDSSALYGTLHFLFAIVLLLVSFPLRTRAEHYNKILLLYHTNVILIKGFSFISKVARYTIHSVDSEWLHITS